MDEKKNLALFFILSLLVSVVFLVICFFDFEKIFNSLFYQIIFLSGLFILMICVFSFRHLIAELRYDINAQKNREKNIQDIYRYNAMMEPPEINN